MTIIAPRLPEPLTPESLKGLMRERAYWDTNHPRFPTYQRLVKRGFEILYPGPVRRDDTGIMIDVPPLPPEQVKHLVAQTNREMDLADGGYGGKSDGAVHVQAHSRDGGKTEASDYWRAAPGHGGADDSAPHDTADGATDDASTEKARTDDPHPDSPLDREFRDGLAKAEQSFGKPDDGYGERTPNDGALGRYQMTEDALKDAGFKDRDTGEWTEKARELGVHKEEDFLKNPVAQEKALADSTAKKDEFLQKNGAKQHLGQKIDGIKAEFEITEAGLAAAAHREGAFAVRQYLDHQERHGWKSDFDSLPKKKREIFEHIETRMRVFQDMPYRRSGTR